MLRPQPDLNRQPSRRQRTALPIELWRPEPSSSPGGARWWLMWSVVLRCGLCWIRTNVVLTPDLQSGPIGLYGNRPNDAARPAFPVEHANSSGSAAVRVGDIVPQGWCLGANLIHCVIFNLRPRPDKCGGGFARVAGLEPATCGFGDRCSSS
jgi:hypothetical protein